MNSFIMPAGVTRRILTQSTRTVVENQFYRVATTLIQKGNLLAIRDITLGALQQLEIPCNIDHTLILVPVTGNINLIRGAITFDLIPGESQILHNETLVISNPFESQLINFLVIETRCPGSLSIGNSRSPSGDQSLHGFDINGCENNMVGITASAVNGLKLSIGKFSGRHNYFLSGRQRHSGIFLFVLEGAFEAAECLLEDRDGLLVQGSSSYEWEALSNNAIILMIG